MEYLQKSLRTVQWQPFSELLKQVPKVQQTERYKDFISGERPARFCVRCIRDGDSHQFKSIDVAKKVGEIVLEATDWKVDLTTMDIEIVVFVYETYLDVGINIPSESKPFSKAHLPSELRSPVVSSSSSPGLRPSTAHLLALLALPLPGDVLVDCMCGSGATLVEAAFSLGCVSLGGDLDLALGPPLRDALRRTRDMNGTAKAEVTQLSLLPAPLTPCRPSTGVHTACRCERAVRTSPCWTCPSAPP